jgi:GTPase
MNSEPNTRAGYVTILGRPNVGKSTFLNAVLGERLSIVTARAQTTWAPVTGILSRPHEQLVILDTPGLLSDAESLIHQSLVETVGAGVRDADVLVLLLDPNRPATEAQREALRAVAGVCRGPLVAAVNKCDVAAEGDLLREEAWAQSLGAVSVHRISAERGDGVEALMDEVAELLPEGPFLYPPDEISTAPVRFFVGELVRETVMERLRDEIPWSVLPKVETFRSGGSGEQRDGRTYIEVILHVERASQKGILIGEGGQMIRTIGAESRAKIERFLDEPVYLDLHVKVLPRWRKKKGELKRMGLTVPDEPHGR